MQCEAMKRDGVTRCRGRALPGDRFCFFHSESTRTQREAGRRSGGQQSRRRAAVLPQAPDVRFADVAGVVTLLGDTATAVRRGDLDCKVANCLAYIGSVALRALQDAELERRIAALEEALRQRGTGNGTGRAARQA